MIHPKRWLQRFLAWRRRPAAAPDSKTGKRKRWIGWTLGVAALLAFFFWFTSARLLKEPIVMSIAVGDREFPESLGPLLGAEFTQGNRVELLVNGVEFFPAMLKAIREAKHTITLETYIWASGRVSDRFVEALAERARAGVRVHVLADGMGSLKFKDEDRKRMTEAGVQLHVYGRKHWYDIKPNINHRTHRKLLVVDGRVGFTGGMCIDDRWDGDADSEKVWRETQIRVEGPVVRQMQAVFAMNWMQTTAELLIGPEYFPPGGGKWFGGALAQCYRSGPGEGPEMARVGYLTAIAAARKSILIANAYFVPDDLTIGMLREAEKRGVDVKVIVPGINDSRFGRAASRSRWGALLHAGVEFYRYEPAMFHSKMMTIDDVYVTIGSTNFDNRSFGINDEVGLNLLDREAAARSRAIFEQDLARSRPITAAEYDARPAWQKAADWFCGLFRSQL